MRVRIRRKTTRGSTVKYALSEITAVGCDETVQIHHDWVRLLLLLQCAHCCCHLFQARTWRNGLPALKTILSGSLQENNLWHAVSQQQAPTTAVYPRLQLILPLLLQSAILFCSLEHEYVNISLRPFLLCKAPFTAWQGCDDASLQRFTLIFFFLNINRNAS